MSDTAPAPHTTRQAQLQQVRDASRSDRVVSTVGYWSPEISLATATGAAGGLLWHPAVAAVAATLLAGRLAAAHLGNRRLRRTRRPAEATPAPGPQAEPQQSEEVRSA